MENLHQSLKGIEREADWVGLRQVLEKTCHRAVRDEKPHTNRTVIDEGCMVEVLIDGHFGYAGTSDTSPSGLQVAARRAREMAQQASRYKVFNFTPVQRPPSRGSFFSPRQSSMDKLGLKELTDILMSASSSMKASDEIVSRLATAMIIESDFKSVSSNGSEVHQNFSMITTSFEATAQRGTETQIRTDNGGMARAAQTGSEVFDGTAIRQRCETIGREALALLSAENCPNGIFDLILAPDQMILQIHESIGHPLEYDRILGDERNYAGWSFVKPEDFGKLKYGSALMNVTFDPHVQGELASYAYDDGGSPALREFLIKDGLLVRGLGGAESQARLNLPGVANFRSSSWNRAPIDRMANINLEPGTTSVEDMIGRTQNGILMRSNKSWSIDDYRNKFQFGCEFAQKIENGKLTAILKNPNYRGITVPFWNSLKSVGSDIQILGTNFCGKGEPNQAIRVGHATPYCLFGNVEVFGA